MGGQKRIDSKYCTPCGTEYFCLGLNDDDNKKEKLARIAYSTPNRMISKSDVNSILRSPTKKAEGRYKGLNILPWLYARKHKASDQTVEFRIHENTNVAERVINWTKVCVRLVDWCAKSTDSEIKELPKSALRTLCIIAPDCKDYILDRIKIWRQCALKSPQILEGIGIVNCDKRRIRLVEGNWTIV